MVAMRDDPIAVLRDVIATAEMGTIDAIATSAEREREIRATYDPAREALGTLALLESIARKFIRINAWFDTGERDDSTSVCIDGWVEDFTPEEMALMRAIRADYMQTAR